MLVVDFPFRKERRDHGLSVVIDSRRQQPVPALLSSLSELQVSQDLMICNYLPAHTSTHPQKFQPLLNLPKSLLSSSSLLWCLTSSSLMQFGFFLFFFKEAAGSRDILAPKGCLRAPVGGTCTYLSVFNHKLGAGTLQSTGRKPIIRL